jgi:hypothetical protein
VQVIGDSILADADTAPTQDINSSAQFAAKFYKT